MKGSGFGVEMKGDIIWRHKFKVRGFREEEESNVEASVCAVGIGTLPLGPVVQTM